MQKICNLAEYNFKKAICATYSKLLMDECAPRYPESANNLVIYVSLFIPDVLDKV